ncbi:MAG: hypothetical protein KatS3mg104_2557 [Phycisphaerae bacterium]|jgi:hypothetical protein|nr:MAG: hypothetical protein KatS3mg104_2557 [Phycisphaerae bacterium]
MRLSASQCRRGSVIIYATFATFAIVGFTALAVDWGRVQLTRSELQAAADAAARYAAAGLHNTIGGVSAARMNASAVVAQNKADGRAITFDPDQDMEVGIWNASTRTFIPSNDLYSVNAVRVTLKCDQDRQSAVPMTFLSILGQPYANVTATSIAAIDYSGVSGGAGMGRFEYYIPATSNPWLAGAPPGTVANLGNPARNPDYAGTPFIDPGNQKNPVNTLLGVGSSSSEGANTSNWAAWGDYASKKSSPITAGGISIIPGSTITFDGVNGGANNFSSTTVYDADGNTGWIIGNYKGNENGIANIKAPINCVIGVFLDDDVPPNNSYPPTLDFSTASSRNFASLKPQLRQPFFIGDGRTSTGEVQQFVVPQGATRLFLGTMDGWEWSNNVGGFNVTAHMTGRIMTVR